MGPFGKKMLTHVCYKIVKIVTICYVSVRGFNSHQGGRTIMTSSGKTLEAYFERVGSTLPF